MTPVDPSVQDEIVTLWNSQLPIRYIAMKVGYSENTIRAFAWSHRDLCTYRHKPTAREKREMWVARLMAGRCTVDEAAKALGVHKTTVRWWLKRTP